MKEIVQVSVVQFAPVWLDKEKSAERMRQFAEQAAQAGSELIVFPEYANIGCYTPLEVGEPPSYDKKTSAAEFAVKFIKAAESVPGPTTETLAEVTKRYGVYIIVGIIQAHPVIQGSLYNSAVLIGPSGVIGIHHKMHLPGIEKFYFTAGNRADVYQTDIGNIGMQICYDGRFPELTRIMALKGAEIICALSATPYIEHQYTEMDKYRADCRAQENGLYFIACNLAGKEGDIVYLGHSAVAKPGGGIIAASESDKEEVLTVQLKNDDIIRVRSSFVGVFRDRRPELYSLITEPLSPPPCCGPIKCKGIKYEKEVSSVRDSRQPITEEKGPESLQNNKP